MAKRGLTDIGATFTARDTSISATLAPEAPERTQATPASRQEGVRLIQAFVRITDRAVREAIIDWVSEQAKLG